MERSVESGGQIKPRIRIWQYHGGNWNIKSERVVRDSKK